MSNAAITLEPVTAKGVTRWVTKHGIGRAVMTAGLRSGDPFARLVYGDAALREDPYPYYAQLRRQAPVVNGRYGMATARYEVIGDLVKGEEFRSGLLEETLPRPMRALMAWAREEQYLGPLERPAMVVNNGPQHLLHRKVVNKAFTPRAVAALEDRVTEMAHDLLDELERGRAAGPVDIVTGYTDVLPVLVIADILGVPAELKAQFLRWGHAIAGVADFGVSLREFRHAEWGVREMHRWLIGHFAKLRREPGTALLGTVVAAADAENPGLSDVELVSIAGLVLAAGFETTVNSLSNGIALLLDHPDQAADLRADPAGWENAVEEVLRFDAPIQKTARYACRDTVLHGVPIPRGKYISPVYAGANRDPEVFTDPDVFDVRRSNAREHLSFAAGGHFCVGAGLARMESRIGLQALFERYPRLLGVGTRVRRPTRTLRGWARLPVLLGAPAAAPPAPGPADRSPLTCGRGSADLAAAAG